MASIAVIAGVLVTTSPFALRPFVGVGPTFVAAGGCWESAIEDEKLPNWVSPTNETSSSSMESFLGVRIRFEALRVRIGAGDGACSSRLLVLAEAYVNGPTTSFPDIVPVGTKCAHQSSHRLPSLIFSCRNPYLNRRIVCIRSFCSLRWSLASGDTDGGRLGMGEGLASAAASISSTSGDEMGSCGRGEPRFLLFVRSLLLRGGMPGAICASCSYATDVDILTLVWSVPTAFAHFGGRSASGDMGGGRLGMGEGLASAAASIVSSTSGDEIGSCGREEVATNPFALRPFAVVGPTFVAAGGCRESAIEREKLPNWVSPTNETSFSLANSS